MRWRRSASAAEIARELGDAELLARAAIGYEEACWRPGIAERGRGRPARGGGGGARRRDLELRVGLLGGLARALDFQGEHERGAIVRTQARSRWRGELGDRAGLATVLMRSYWARGHELAARRSSRCSPRRRDLAEALGNTEIRAEAMAWRVPTFVALGDLESARREVAALRETAEQTAQPFMHPRRRALRLGDRARRRAPGRSRGAARALARVEPAADRTGRLRASTASRCSASAASRAGWRSWRPVVRILAGEAGRDGAVAPGLVAVLAELGMEDEARRELARLAAEGLDRFRDVALAGLAHLPDRRLRGARRRGDGRASSTRSWSRLQGRT